MIFTQGNRVRGEFARLVFLEGSGLVGIAVSKKIGNRPQRNRAKRRFREAIRTQPELLNPRMDMVVSVMQSGASAPFEVIRADLKTIISKANERWASDLECS